MLDIKILSGDATKVPCDALVTLINSGKMWFGGMDNAIYRTSGQQFHVQAAFAIDKYELSDGQAVFATGKSISGKFNAVIFVIDDLHLPLERLVFIALMSARENHCQSVVLPTLRTGIMAGVVEKTLEDTIKALVNGIRTFEEAHPNTPMTITFVAYNDERIVKLLQEAVQG